MERIGITIKKKSASGAYKAEARSPANKISKETIVGGFTKIPNFSILDPALTCQDRSVFSVLCFHAFQKIWCNPAQQTIAKEAGISERAVRDSLKKLKKLGYIDWQRTMKANRYVLLHKAKKL